MSVNLQLGVNALKSHLLSDAGYDTTSNLESQDTSGLLEQA